jgi:hypothetical protein
MVQPPPLRPLALPPLRLGAGETIDLMDHAEEAFEITFGIQWSDLHNDELVHLAMHTAVDV